MRATLLVFVLVGAWQTGQSIVAGSDVSERMGVTSAVVVVAGGAVPGFKVGVGGETGWSCGSGLSGVCGGEEFDGRPDGRETGMGWYAEAVAGGRSRWSTE